MLHGWHDGCSTPATVFSLKHNQLSRGDRSVRGFGHLCRLARFLRISAFILAAPEP